MTLDIMVMDLSDGERGNPLSSLHGLRFLLAARKIYVNHPTNSISNTTAFAAPAVEHWLE